jgi:hypothetical protein
MIPAYVCALDKFKASTALLTTLALGMLPVVEPLLICNVPALIVVESVNVTFAIGLRTMIHYNFTHKTLIFFSVNCILLAV